MLMHLHLRLQMMMWRNLNSLPQIKAFKHLNLVQAYLHLKLFQLQLLGILRRNTSWISMLLWAQERMEESPKKMYSTSCRDPYFQQNNKWQQ